MNQNIKELISILPNFTFFAIVIGILIGLSVTIYLYFFTNKPHKK